MLTLIRREFLVDVPVQVAWQHLARVEEWPSWAKHIQSIEVEPSGEITSQSRGRIHLRHGVKSTFQVIEFYPGQNWKWIGFFLWLTVHYDHRFESVDAQRTKLIWIVSAEGLGVSVFGRLFAAIYKKNLERAIPRLVAEMKATGA